MSGQCRGDFHSNVVQYEELLASKYKLLYLLIEAADYNTISWPWVRLSLTYLSPLPVAKCTLARVGGIGSARMTDCGEPRRSARARKLPDYCQVRVNKGILPHNRFSKGERKGFAAFLPIASRQRQR